MGQEGPGQLTAEKLGEATDLQAGLLGKTVQHSLCDEEIELS